MPQALAFRGAWAQIEVYSPGEGRSQRFDVGAVRSGGDYMPYFTSMMIRSSLAHDSETEVVLSPPTYESFIDLIESPWVRRLNTLSVRWGYTDAPQHTSPWHHSLMIDPDISIDQDSFAITLKGTGFSLNMLKKGSSKVWASEDGVPGPRSLESVAKEIADSYGMPLVVNRGQPLDDRIDKQWKKPRKALVQAGINDWAFLRKEVSAIGLFMFVSKGFELHVFKGTNVVTPKSVFRVYGDVQPSNGVFPVWGFSMDTKAFFLPGRGIAARTFGPNADRSQKAGTVEASSASHTFRGSPNGLSTYGTIITSVGAAGLAIPRKAEDEATNAPDVAGAPAAGGVKASVAPKGDQAAMFLPIVAQDEKGEAIAFGFSDQSAEKLGIPMEWDSLDDPTLDAGDVVGFAGAGKQFDGNFRISAIEHRIGGGEFGSMHLKVMRLGLDPKFQNDGTTEAAADAKEEEADTSGSEKVQADEEAGA